MVELLWCTFFQDDIWVVNETSVLTVNHSYWFYIMVDGLSEFLDTNLSTKGPSQVLNPLATGHSWQLGNLTM